MITLPFSGFMLILGLSTLGCALIAFELGLVQGFKDGKRSQAECFWSDEEGD